MTIFFFFFIYLLDSSNKKPMPSLSGGFVLGNWQLQCTFQPHMPCQCHSFFGNIFFLDVFCVCLSVYFVDGRLSFIVSSRQYCVVISKLCRGSYLLSKYCCIAININTIYLFYFIFFSLCATGFGMHSLIKDVLKYF